MSVGKKLFVGNLPYDTSDQELERAFSEHGEVKAAFTVKEKGVTDRNKGYGYVVFSSKEACELARIHVKVIKGRPVKVTLAESKKAKMKLSKDTDPDSNHDDENDSDESDYEALTAKSGLGSKLKRCKSARGEARFDVGRTVVLKPLPPTVSEEEVRSLCEGKGQIVSVGVAKDQDTTQGLVTLSTHKEARSLVHQLDGLKVGGAKVAVVLLSRATKGVSQATLRKSRLIVRNLSFKCEEVELRRVFEEYGRVLEVKVPRKENGYMLGYAFVQFGSYFDAARALERVNGQPIKGRPVAVDWVVPKSKYEQAIRKATPTAPADETGEEESAFSEGSDPEDGDSEGRDSGDDCGAGDSSDGGEAGDSSDGGGAGDSSDSGEGVSDEEVESMSVESDEKSGRGQSASDVTEGRTLFIRGLPVGTHHSDLSQLFTQFGPVRYCRVLNDPQSGLSRGCGFLQFRKQSTVQSCLDTANGDGLHYHGNKLTVSMAVPKSEAQGFKGQRVKVKEDKRNLYLAKEGVILPGTPAAEQLSKVDMARRMRAYSERKAKLANPNFFVSKTRLSVRNIPTGVDEKALKRVFLKSADLAPSVVSQVKILRSTERFDGRGLGRSLGYGFMEFKGHDDALKALRSTNNNPELFGEKRRLIVEFAIENSRVLNLRAQRKHRQIKTKDQKSAESTLEATPTDPHSSKRQKWRLKWKARRLKRKIEATSSGHTSTTTKPNVSDNRDVHGKKIHREKGPSISSTPVSGSLAKGLKRTSALNAQSPSKRTNKQAIGQNEYSSRNKVKGRNQGSRKQKARRSSEKEEVNFESMVNKYRQKLEKSSFSKWVT